MPSAWPFELAAFLVGLLLGSFLNVCIVRLPRGESIVTPRSRCPHCLHPVAAYDNLPLVSWVLLRAKCRHCNTSISWRYPAVELCTALWFALTAAVLFHALSLPASAATSHTGVLPLVLDACGIAALGFLLLGLLVMDWQTHTLPDGFTLGGIATGLLLTFVQAAFLPMGQGDLHFTPRSSMRLASPGSFAARGDVFLTGTEALVMGRVAAIVAAGGMLLLINATYKALRGRDGLGLGDAKLLAMIAAFLGFGDAMLSFFLGMIACAAYALYLLVRGRATATTHLPLGSFLAAGGLFTALGGEAVLTWYKGLL